MLLKPSCKEIAARLGKKLHAKSLTIATAESCTGGLIGAAITSVPGSSVWFRGGIIAYDNAIKTSLLKIPASTLKRYGAVSEETVSAMAAGAAHILGTDCAVAVSGIAGPNGGTEEKPVGLVYIGAYYHNKIDVNKHQFPGDRESVREQTAETALEKVIALIEPRH